MKYIIPLIFIAILLISQIGCKSESTTQPNPTGGVSYVVKHFVNNTGDTVFFYGIPNVNVKMDSINTKAPNAQTWSYTTFNGALWKNTDSLIFDWNSSNITGNYTFTFYGKTEANNTAFNVPVNYTY
jgi:hypothetical protein